MLPLDFVGADETESEAAYMAMFSGPRDRFRRVFTPCGVVPKRPTPDITALALQERIVLFATHHVGSLMK
jgi:hypothetical protein